MYATTDGNFFHEENKQYADSHAKSNKLEVVTITVDDVNRVSIFWKIYVKSGHLFPLIISSISSKYLNVILKITRKTIIYILTWIVATIGAIMTALVVAYIWEHRQEIKQWVVAMMK